MATKLQTLDVSEAIAPFAKALGDDFDKIVRDIKSMLGDIKDKDVEIKLGEWKATAGFKLKARDGHTVQLAPNMPSTVLLCFGMRLNDLAKNGSFDVQADIPKACVAWIQQHRAAKSTTLVPV